MANEYIIHTFDKKMQLPIRKELFWDMDVNSLDEQKHKVHIIQQVLNFGTLEEFSAVKNYYGWEGIKEAVKEVGYLDPKTFAFVTEVMKVDKNELKCYTKKRLNQPHWS